jgi:methyltransferase-like protein
LEQIEEATLGVNLMNLYAKGFIEIHAEPVAISLTVAERPQASALARYQAGNSRLVTNRLHAPLPADALGRAIIAACDGEHSVAQVVEAVMQEVKAGRLNVQEGDKPVQDDKRLRELLDPQTRGMLQLLARTGFFAP